MKIHDALVAHIAAAPNTLFVIPAELIQPNSNDSYIILPTEDDMKAVEKAVGVGQYMLTNDFGNAKVTSTSASNAPALSGCEYDLDGTAVKIELTDEQVMAKQTAAKLFYEVALDNDAIAAYGGLDKLKKNLTLVMSANGAALKAVGPGSDALISFTDALDSGIATLILTSTGVIVGLDFILIDGAGKSEIYNDKIVVFDGAKDGVLNGSIWPATYKSDGDSSGCDAGFVFAAAGLLTALVFMRKRSK